MFALFQNLPQNLIFIVCSPAVHRRTTLAKGVDTSSRVTVVTVGMPLAGWGRCLLRNGRFSGFLAMLLIVDGEVTGVLLSKAGRVSLLIHSDYLPGANVEIAQ